MNTPTQTDQKQIKVQFLFLYAFSLVLIFIVVSAFFRKSDAGVVSPNEQQVLENESYLIQLDKMLHTRMEQLDNAYLAYMRSNKAPGSKEAADLASIRNALSATLDSIEKQSLSSGDGSKKQMTNLAATRFKSFFRAKDKLVSELVLLPNTGPNPSDNSATTTAPGNVQMDQLQKLLVQKDQQIVLLQNELQQKENDLRTTSTTTTSGADANEWKQKYTALKGSFDKVSASEKSLKNAYKTVADDNKRLLSQLEALRKG